MEHTATPAHASAPAPLDLSEKGRGGTMDRRLYVQFLAFGDVPNVASLAEALTTLDAKTALYLDMNDARGVGVVCTHEDPAFFVTTYRTFLTKEPFVSLSQKHAFTMTGRTYAIGYEPDLEETLFIRPLSRILNPELAWAIWYPLRRRGAFEQLSSEAQRDILKEHGTIGHQFGTAQLAYDVRLDCHGLDAADNDFVIGILGRELTPLSKVVEHMRATTQTAQYLEKLGPFFVGKVYAQHG